MKQRPFGGDSALVSEVGLGCWQFGGDAWGEVTETDALTSMRAAVEAGITFFDTADVYGLGRSEELIGRFLRESRKPLFVATKLGRFPQPGGLENYQPHTIQSHVEASLRRLGVETLDLVQLHCVPKAVLEQGDVFEVLRAIRKAGKIRRFGASVESAAEARICLAQEGLASLQVIFNVLRQTPIAYFAEAQAKGVAIIVRLPLASGLLAGKYTPQTTFAGNDHRSFNENGEKFNVGETFAGFGFAKGLQLIENLRSLVPAGYSLAQFALRWCLDFPAVSVIIPGARNPLQVHGNAAVSELPPMSAEQHEQLKRFYQENVVPHLRGPD